MREPNEKNTYCLTLNCGALATDLSFLAVAAVAVVLLPLVDELPLSDVVSESSSESSSPDELLLLESLASLGFGFDLDMPACA